MKYALILAAVAAALAAPAHAAETLTFDPVPDRGNPREYYNGGFAIDRFGQRVGSPGPALGIRITGDAFVQEKIRQCPGGGVCGSSLFPTAPSGLRALGAAFSPDAFRRVTFNLAAGFTGELSFWSYVPGGSRAAPGGVSIFGKIGGNQSSNNPVLGSLGLPAPTTCIFTVVVVTEVSGCNFIKHTISFAGTARSVVVGGAFFDDMTFGAVSAPPPVGGVPEPASWTMLLAGFGLTGAALRRRPRVVAA